MPAGTAHQVSELDLASRLSFFLWSSIPDDELLNLAIAGRLRAPGVLDAQVRRMVADPRADALMNNFTGQWLQLRNLDKVTPDVLLFPDFDDNVRQAFRRETELFFASIVRENRSALDLLECRLHVREREAGEALRHPRRLRLALPPRAGDRSEQARPAGSRQHPVDDVGGQSNVACAAREVHHLESAEHAAAAAARRRAGSVRERAQGSAVNGARTARTASREPGVRLVPPQHRSGRDSPSRTSTPWGSGRLRRRKGSPSTRPDSSPTARKIDGPVALRKALLARPDVFVGTITEKLLIYALGRGLEPVDMPVVRNVVTTAAAQNYAMQSIVLGIVRSVPFQMRTTMRAPAAP